MKKYMHKLQGFSLLEILLAITLFSLVIIAVGTLILEGVRSSKNQALRDTSIYNIKEIYNAVTITKNDLWSDIVNNTGNGQKHLNFAANKYTILDGSQTTGGVTIAFTISIANRDAGGNIVTTGGTPDSHTRTINIVASWVDIMNRTNTLSSMIYVNDWNTLNWTQTTAADFNNGTNNQTMVASSTGDGDVELGRVFYPDWCRPRSMTTYNIPGSATAKTLLSYPGVSYMGTGGQSGGTAFTKVTIAGVDPPVITVAGTFNGYLTNDIFVVGNYAYLATSTNNKQVVILDLSQTPYTEVGYFQASRTGAANSVYVVGNTGYVAIGTYVYSFDLTAQTGKRSQLSNVQLAISPNYAQTDYVSQIIVKGNYLYASLYQDWYELAIADVSNRSKLKEISETSVNDGQAEDIQLNAAATRVYFGTDWVSYEPDFFIVDVTTKNQDNRPTIGSYTTPDHMNIYGVALVESDKRVLTVGYGGTYQYQALNITNESAPVQCGTMQEATGINDVSNVTDSFGNAWAYILTNDPSNEFKIFRGGPGVGGDPNTGWGWSTTGDYTSQIFDSGTATTNYYYLEWTGTIPTNSTMKIQMRAGISPADIAAQTWVGPDGTAASYFTSQTATNFPASFMNKRYLQYKVWFTSDTLETPQLSSISVTYQK